MYGPNYQDISPHFDALKLSCLLKDASWGSLSSAFLRDNSFACCTFVDNKVWGERHRLPPKFVQTFKLCCIPVCFRCEGCLQVWSNSSLLPTVDCEMIKELFDKRGSLFTGKVSVRRFDTLRGHAHFGEYCVKMDHSASKYAQEQVQIRQTLLLKLLCKLAGVATMYSRFSMVVWEWKTLQMLTPAYQKGLPTVPNWTLHSVA